MWIGTVDTGRHPYRWIRLIARFDQMVLEGKDQMPAWQGVLNEQEPNQFWAYIGAHARK